MIRLSVVAAILGIAGSAAALFGTRSVRQQLRRLVALLYVLLTPPAIVTGAASSSSARRAAVTIQTMFGVLCLYLLIGLLFGVAFAPSIQDISGTPSSRPGRAAGRDDFLYFSYTTLTTVGYGDLVAATNLGRSLAITEALLGQIYLVSVVALIISNLRRAPAARVAQTDR